MICPRFFGGVIRKELEWYLSIYADQNVILYFSK